MNPLKRTVEASLYTWNRLTHYPAGQTRVVIFGQGRTGSTLLESLLCSTGHFDKHGEVFNRDNYGSAGSPVRFIEGLAKWTRKSNFIFHVKVYQLTERMDPVDPAAFLSELVDQGWRIVYLRRENVIKHSLSNTIAVRRGEYFKYDDEKEDLEITIEDCEKFAVGVGGRRQHTRLEQKVLEGLEHHEVVYERDLESAHTHQDTVDAILDFLSMERRKATTHLRKVNTWQMSEFIANYAEFAECMTRHGLQRFLDDDSEISEGERR